MMIKKRNFNFFSFLALIFLFLSLFLRKNIIAPLVDGMLKKIHGATALTATAPLLNLNLNYEKLRRKYNKFYQITIKLREF